MRTFESIADLGVLGEVGVFIEYTVEGQYFPATQDSPSEHPYVEIRRIVATIGSEEVDVTSLIDHDEYLIEISEYEFQKDSED